MNEFDQFCSELLEQSKRLLEKAKEEGDPEGKQAYNNAGLLMSICALEAYINGIAEEVCLVVDYPLQLKGALLEKEIRLDGGEFYLSNTLKMARLTDRIEILYKKHGQKTFSETWWITLKRGIDFRNKIVHPKESVVITTELLEQVILAVIECLKALYKAVYNRPFPKGNLSLVSRFNF